MKRACSVIVAGFLFLLIIWVDIVALRTPDSDYSELEQRDLTLAPKYTDFAQWVTEMEQYLQDQFPLRSELIKQYHSVQAATGNNVVQDLYQLDSDYLFAFTYPTKDKSTELMAEELKAAGDKYGIPVVYGIMPLKTVSLADSVEELSNETNLLNRDRTVNAMSKYGLQYIDVCSAFLDNYSQEELKDFYFKTDFHWNNKGGYNAGLAIGQALQEMGLVSELPLTSDFIWVDFTEDRSYMGDLQRRLSPDPFPGEYIPYYELRKQEGLHYYTEIDGEEVDRGSIVACGLEEEIFEYNRVCTYNLGYLRIVNDNAPNKKSVLIFKDSYENMLTDYLSGMFSEIIVMDPRVLKYSFSDVMDRCNVDMILCIYHESNVSEELIKFIK